MPKVLLPVSHLRQRSESDCLAACAAMVLQYLRFDLEYADLLLLLQIRNFGAPAGNIRRLSQRGLHVTYSVSDLAGLHQLVNGGTPVIVFVRTGDLPYWSHSTDHALVVVGFDSDVQQVLAHDPYFDQGPQAIPEGDFDLAWSERDYHYATITR